MPDKNNIDYTSVPSNKAMAGNTLWNMIGMGLPLLIGLIALKVLPGAESGLGGEKMELLGIVWMLVGFTSIFDMGLGHALTKIFSDKLSTGRRDDLHGLFWTAVIMVVGIGILAGATVLAVIPLVTGGDIEPDLLTEARRSFVIVGLAMPIMILNVGMCGVLQACRQFKLLNLIRIPAGSFTFLSPLCVLPFTRRLDVVVLVLIAGRAVEMLAYFFGCLSSLPGLKRMPVFVKNEMRALLGFGSWMTVSNISVGIMTFVNRFIIRMVRKLGEGMYYLIPEEMVVRALMIPRAWIDVLFPAFVTSFNNKKEKPGDLLEKGLLYLILVMTPVAAGMSLILPDFFAVWIPDGVVFAQKSSFVVRCLTLGVFIHGFGRVVWYFLLAAGRPDLSARLHLVELLLSVCCAYFLISSYGIKGAAIAWLARVTVDFLLLFMMAMRYIERPGVIAVRTFVPLLIAIVIILLVTLPQALVVRLGLCAICLILFYAVCWFKVLTDRERTELVGFVRARFRS